MARTRTASFQTTLKRMPWAALSPTAGRGLEPALRGGVGEPLAFMTGLDSVVCLPPTPGSKGSRKGIHQKCERAASLQGLQRVAGGFGFCGVGGGGGKMGGRKMGG